LCYRIDIETAAVVANDDFHLLAKILYLNNKKAVTHLSNANHKLVDAAGLELTV
jgi:hypothetical protein